MTMDVTPPTSQCDSAVNKQYSAIEIELYYLMVKYLSAGPCKKAYEVLKAEIEENELLPKRHDWLGNEKKKTFSEVDCQNSHVRKDHLLRLVSRLGPAIDQLVKLPWQSTFSLLGAGSQSLLRREEDLWKRYRTLSDVLVRHHSCPPLEPVKVSGPPCLTQTLLGRELLGNVNHKHVVTEKFYNRIQLFLRSVGHLSAVYCMLFDRSGKYIITGADDMLVKIWSTLDGRLMATLRGASAEISDLAIDSENSLIAAGSCDKIIRVWSLQTLAPVAVLSSHTGVITALQFCPAPDNEGVLISTGGDGCVCFWTYIRRNDDVKFDLKPLKVNERIRPGNAQLICASFSHGGNFLAVGGVDHFVRVYHLGGEDGVEKLLEAERHQDRVDSIQWCHKGLRFITGSRDGTALIWYYERQGWQNIILNMTERFPGDDPPSEEIRRLQVTMVGWNRTDEFVITASNDKWLRVWESASGQLKQILKGHEDNAYVIEAHPSESRLVLTAGHDGQLMIWDIFTGTLVWNFKNTIEGQGYGALFDAKWSPDGFMIASTDSHGHLILFGIGHNEKFKRIPKELFFHTDYRPLMRDSNHHVLDEQTQMAPHLMPPPFLVNMDGDPYPPEYQRLVPGRENCRHDQLIPNVILNANGDQEVLDAALNYNDQPPSSVPPAQVASSSQVPESAHGTRPNIDEMIQRLAEEQDQRIAHDRVDSGGVQPGPSGVGERRESTNSSRGERRPSSSGPPNDHSYAVASLHDPLSPRASRVGARRVGDVEGVRQSTGNWQRDPNIKWSRRVIVRRQENAILIQSLERRKILGVLELQIYDEESRKKPEPVRVPEEPQQEPERKTRKKQKKTPAYVTRSVRDSRRNSYDGNEAEDHAGGSPSPKSSSGSEIENDELQESSSSDEQSTDYSDWTAEAGVNLEPPKRTAHKQKKSPRKRKRKKRGSDFEENDKDEDDEEDEKLEESKNTARVNQRVQRQPRGPRPNLSEISGGADEIPEEFRPPEWLTETFPKKAPYFPQMGDELIYFMQGHMLYVEAVMNRKLYTIDKRNLPWMRTVNKLRDQEYVKIIGIKYEIKPPRLCCLKLGILEAGTGKLTSDSFTIKYHDMPDVLDFLILKATYDVAVNRHWRTGDRFRCIIDDAWWFGTVERQEPHLPEFPDSMFMCYRVLWDNGEQERLSPWDMEIIDEESADVVERGGSLAVKQDELEDLLYTPSDEEWAGRNPDLECDRISYGLSKIMSLAIAEPFLVPVDLNDYPMYALIIDYPMDLTTIKSRLDNRFYRRINAVQFDVRYLATNTEKFNQKGSNIVRQARIVTELCLELIKDGTCTDPTQLYHQLQANYHSPDHSGDEGYERGESRFKNYGKSVKGRNPGKVDRRTWQQMCKDLLKSIFEREDSMPFRYPVDLDRYPDYSQVIEVPMDLTTVREELSTSAYATPLEYAKDMRLIFLNSKNYNTNKRSRIYSMTLRLEAYFEDQIKSVLAKYNQGKRGQVKTNLRSQKGKLSSTCVKGASGSPISSGIRRGVQKRLPSPGLSLPSASGTRSGTAGKLGGTRTKHGPSTGSSDLRSGVSTTAFGRAVVPPYRADFSHSASYGEDVNELDYDDEEDDDEQDPISSKDGTRRSRRVAKKNRHQIDVNDSGEEYNPRNKQKKVAKKSKKKGVATRNRGKVRVQYNEDSDDEDGTSKLSNKTQSKTKISSDESDDSEGSNSDSLRRTNGQIYAGKNRLHSSSESESDERSKASNNSGGMNGITSKKLDNLSKRKSSAESDGSESDTGSDSSSDTSSSNIDITGKSERNKVSSVKRLPLSSDDSCDSTSIGKKHSKNSNQPSKGQYGQRKLPKDESEVEFDDEDLESSTEDSADDDDLKRGRKRGGVGSSVRRARKIILDGDDDDDADFIVDADKDFIDDADLSPEESSTESESEDGSDDLTFKKKKEKKKPKPAKKKITKKNAKKPAKKNPPKKPATKKVAKKTPSKALNKNKPPVKKTPTKKAPVNKNAGPSTKRTPVKREHIQELISLTQPGQAPIPFQPINTAGQKVIVNEVKHKGRVVGRVITSQYADDDDDDDDDDETESSEDSEESSYSSDDETTGNIINSGRPLPPPLPTIQLPIGVKRIYETESESEIAEGWQPQKRTRNEEECDEVDVSSRGRVRKANTLMRDFI
ncbi:bromodomain and WD repeat-containing protein 3 isoform X2 [Macrobrachium rosenbergii]|uniref:bromodomain and WD repeat-containing protein 3 isoform X2 n=1 Tax=Macrobrachium rosenbergii TaxID=79674 RepID=UPI0034D5EDE8